MAGGEGGENEVKPPPLPPITESPPSPPSPLAFHVVAARQMAADKTSPDIEVRTKQRCVIEFLHAEKIAPIDIHRRLLNVYGDQTVDVSTVRRWVGRFSSGDSDVKDKPRSGRPCTAVTPRNERRLEQLIRQNPWITTRELRAELKIGFNALETMVATSDYRNVCGMWVPRVFANPLHVCRDVWTRGEGEGEGFLGRIITVDAPSNSENHSDGEGPPPKWSRKGAEA